MRLFIRDHAVLIGAHLTTLLLVLLVYLLDGYRNGLTALYAIFLGSLVLLVYLSYRYWTHRGYYNQLSKPMNQLEESLQSMGHAPLPAAAGELLKSQYRLYQQQLQHNEHRRKEHLTFIHQWVHQMKTPLSVIHLTVQHQQDEAAVSIREEAERLDRGLEMVLYAARLEAFEQDFQVEPVGLRELVDQVVHEHKRMFIRNEVYPENKVDPVLKVETDAKWMRFVLSQLLSNAIKYSRGSKQRVTFDVIHEPGESVVLTIQDRGVGIPAADLKRVFRPFFTGDNGRSFSESTGMGLYLVQKICSHLQHQVQLDSEVGRGTTARITFTSSNLTRL